MNSNQLSYAYSKLCEIVTKLAVGEGDARSRLYEIYPILCRVSPSALPKELQRDMEWIHQQLTKPLKCGRDLLLFVVALPFLPLLVVALVPEYWGLRHTYTEDTPESKRYRETREKMDEFIERDMVTEVKAGQGQKAAPSPEEG